jgi:ABC-type dipeptide/oligopeptide/nickel transport system permease subunit
VALGAFIFGSLFGAIAGYAGGTVNGLMMRIADAFLTFPALAGVVFLQQMMGVMAEALGGIVWFNADYFGSSTFFQTPPPAYVTFLLKIDPILTCLILFSWMPIARIVNTMVITLKNTEFIQAARALGGNPFWIIRRHLLPNAIGPAIVLAARDVSSSVIMQATITFIGLGGTAPWAVLLSLGRNWVIGPGGSLLAAWWVFIPPTLAIVLFGMGWNLLGDGLTEALEPDIVIKESRRSKRKQKMMSEAAPISIHQPLDSAEVSFLPRTAAVTSARIPVGGPPEADLLLQAARDALLRQDVEQAMHAFKHLSQRGRHTQEVIRDLAQAARKFPRHPLVWKTLGDVLAQAGNHEYAAKAYEQYRLLTQ